MYSIQWQNLIPSDLTRPAYKDGIAMYSYFIHAFNDLSTFNLIAMHAESDAELSAINQYRADRKLLHVKCSEIPVGISDPVVSP